MADFGICENPDCQLSYRSLSLTALFSRINAISGMEKRKDDVSGILPHLKRSHSFFSLGLTAPGAVNSCIGLFSPPQICRQNPKNIFDAQN